MPPKLSKLLKGLLSLGPFTLYCLKRFRDDDGPRTAAALSYTTLLAIVPLITIGFAVFSAFGTLDSMKADVQQWLFDSLLPDAASAVSQYLGDFVNNASKMTGAGLLGLAVAAVLLLNTITGALNATWKASDHRPWTIRVLVFWALVTLGPLLIGASISLSTYAYTAVQLTGLQAYDGPDLGLSRIVTFLLSAVGFTLLFVVVPNRSVRVRHAVIGAIIAAILFELLKRGFGIYVTRFPTYEAIYGALAAVPIFLVWMYLSWTVLLLGAEIAAALPEWQAAELRRNAPHPTGAKLVLALALLGRLKEAAKEGRIPREMSLSRGLPVTLDELDKVLGLLRRAGYVARSGRSRWVLSRDLNSVTLTDLVSVLGLSYHAGPGWPDEVVQAVDTLAAASAEAGNCSLAEVLEKQAEMDPPIKLSSLG